MRRDPDYTAAVIRAAATREGVDPDPLVRFAEARAAVGGLDVRDDYDLPVEGMQEAGDGTNYTSWDTQRVAADPGPDAAAELYHLQGALQGFARAYHHLRLLRELRRTA